MIFFIIGCLLGTFFGFLLCALLVMSGDDDNGLH